MRWPWVETYQVGQYCPECGCPFKRYLRTEWISDYDINTGIAMIHKREYIVCRTLKKWWLHPYYKTSNKIIVPFESDCKKIEEAEKEINRLREAIDASTY